MAAASPTITPQILEGAAAEVRIELTREVSLFIPCVNQHPVQRSPEICKTHVPLRGRLYTRPPAGGAPFRTSCEISRGVLLGVVPLSAASSVMAAAHISATGGLRMSTGCASLYTAHH